MSCTVGNFWEGCIIDAHPGAVFFGAIVVFVVLLLLTLTTCGILSDLYHWFRKKEK